MSKEKILDRAFEDAVKNNPPFRAWFLGKLKHGPGYANYYWSRSNYPYGKVKLLLPNSATGALEMVEREGETDVLLVFQNDDASRLGVHVENKLASSRFTSFQPEVCAARADHWVRNADYGNYVVWETVLLAPKSFYERNSVEARKFMTFVSHEDVAAHIPVFAV